ncbi:hypothetical protein Tco_0228655, partial [Tanacetum coccineum]
EDEGAVSERPSETQPTPSPPHPSADQHETQHDLSPRPLPTIPIPDSILEGSSRNHGGQSSSDRSLSGNKDGLTLQSIYDLCILDDKCIHEAKIGRKEIIEEKVDAKGVYEGTDKPKVSNDKPKVSTDKPEVSTAKPTEVEVSTDKLDEGTDEPKDGTSNESTAPTTVFRDDETIAEFLVSMSQNKAKQKGVEIKDAKDSNRPKGYINRSLEGARDIWEAEEEMKKLAGEEATKAALIQYFDDIQARIEADRLLAVRLQEEERETFTVEERAKFLYDTIAAQRRFLAQQRAAAIRSRPPIRTQLRNQMMTYLKHVGGKKHVDLKNKNFEEIQVLYKKVKRSDKFFIAIGSAEDERQIKEMNEESKDPKKKRLKKRVVNETSRKRPRPQPDDDSDDEHRKCLRIVTFDSTIDSEIMETKSFVSKLHKVSSPDGDYLVVYRVNGHFRAFNYLMEVLHIFDRQDLFHLYDLVMKQYSEITPEGIELILWGDLKIMMESSTEENDQGDFWNNQQEWEIFRWRLYEACGVCILELKDGTVIYMLVERRYPLSKELLQRMLDLGLEVEEESTAALHLVRFIKQQLNEE